MLLIVCKGAAYGLSLSSFRGGPVFPGMFIGAALGIAVSHLPGLPMIAGVGMGIGAMTVAMLGLPLVSVLLASLLLSADGVQLIPLIIVAVVVSYVLSAAPEAPARTRARRRPQRPERTGPTRWTGQRPRWPRAQPLSDRRRKVIVWSTAPAPSPPR